MNFYYFFIRHLKNIALESVFSFVRYQSFELSVLFFLNFYICIALALLFTIIVLVLVLFIQYFDIIGLTSRRASSLLCKTNPASVLHNGDIKIGPVKQEV